VTYDIQLFQSTGYVWAETEDDLERAKRRADAILPYGTHVLVTDRVTAEIVYETHLSVAKP
jgi:hypothetical protein